MARTDAELHRAHHRRSGEPYRWLKRFPSVGSNEPDYIEQTLSSAVRGLFYRTVREFDLGDFGFFPVGSAAFSVMPDESTLLSGDLIVLNSRLAIARQPMQSGQSTLAQPYPVEILEIRNGATLYVRNTNYSVSGMAVTWITTEPTNYTVEYSYRPQYSFVPFSDQLPRPDKNGILMPQRGLLKMWVPS